MPSVVHDTTRYANNRAEVSHRTTRWREQHTRRFESVAQAERFLAVDDVVRNLFRRATSRKRFKFSSARAKVMRQFLATNCP
jgi:putative transposase